MQATGEKNRVAAMVASPISGSVLRNIVGHVEEGGAVMLKVR